MIVWLFINDMAFLIMYSMPLCLIDCFSPIFVIFFFFYSFWSGERDGEKKKTLNVTILVIEKAIKIYPNEQIFIKLLWEKKKLVKQLACITLTRLGVFDKKRMFVKKKSVNLWFKESRWIWLVLLFFFIEN